MLRDMHESAFHPHSAAPACGCFGEGLQVAQLALANVVVTLLLLERAGTA